MNKITLFLSVLLLTGAIQQIIASSEVILESDVIKLVDGSFINADTIEFMRKFRRKILALLFGDPTLQEKRIGRYSLDGKKYSVRDLAYIEQKASSKKEKKLLKKFVSILAQAKKDFVSISEEFLESARGAKGILMVLIEEDCLKRDHPNSLLLEWAQTKEEQETIMFEKSITNFTRYYSLCSNLLNFLADLIHSCPKAEAQFEARVTKWKKVKTLLPYIIKNAKLPKNVTFNETVFLKHVKDNYLDKLELEELTSKKIQELLVEFIKKQ